METTENNREAKYYALTRTGEKALADEMERWDKLAVLMQKRLGERA